ncbi:MAG: fructose bisphosphate aldolase [Clostridia bacterium]
MNEKMYEIMKDGRGFIAALDQSGGSSSKTLKLYGIDESEYSSEEEMFNLIHEMRKRVMTSKAFTNEHILGTILFEKTMMSEVNGKFTADYLWEDKGIVSFLKVDKGLQEQKNGVKLMKEIPNLKEQLAEANKKNVFGTKMRSVIYEANEEGIRDIVNQQFEFAKVICDSGLVPIIEPEVDIHSAEKELCEKMLKDEVIKHLKDWNPADKIMFKFTIPTVANHYLDLYDYDCVVRIVALSGGYSMEEACKLLSENKKMIASFSRALLQDLNVHQTAEEFDTALDTAITKIYNASID